VLPCCLLQLIIVDRRVSCWGCLLQAGVTVGGIMGTSAGALTGSLYAAGYTPKEVGQGL
jgi:hypothetical protein